MSVLGCVACGGEDAVSPMRVTSRANGIGRSELGCTRRCTPAESRKMAPGAYLLATGLRAGQASGQIVREMSAYTRHALR